jgi:hypothetical protein
VSPTEHIQLQLGFCRRGVFALDAYSMVQGLGVPNSVQSNAIRVFKSRQCLSLTCFHMPFVPHPYVSHYIPISTRAKMKLNIYCDPNGRPALAAALNMGCPIHCSLGTKAVQQRIVVPLGALV